MPALAEDIDDLETHAFLSQGYIKTSDNNYLAKSKTGSFGFTEVGINFTKQLRDDLRMGLQLFGRNLGSTGNLDARMDWFYLDYRSSDYLGIRFGRVKLPFGLYNDTSDIDSARASVLMPPSVYPTLNRNYLLAQSGLEIYGNARSESAGSLEYRLYAGTIMLDINNTLGAAAQVRDFNVPYVYGGRLLWNMPVEGLRLGITAQALRLDSSIVFSASPTAVTTQIPATLWVGSIEYTHDDLLLATEYSRWHVSVKNSSNETLFPNMHTVSERAYVSAAYRVSQWLQPALYYSVLFPNVENRKGVQNHQNDLALTFRFDINPFWLVKLEGHYMDGTAGLSAALNNGTALKDLTRKWGVYLLKTTAYF